MRKIKIKIKGLKYVFLKSIGTKIDVLKLLGLKLTKADSTRLKINV